MTQYIASILHRLHQTRPGPVGHQLPHLPIFVWARPHKLDDSLSRPPLSLRSRQFPTHHHPTQTESVVLPLHYMRNAPLLPPSNYATLHSHQSSHVLLSRQTPSNHIRPTTALFTLPPIHPPLHYPAPPSSHYLMVNSYLFSTVPMRSWNLFLPAQQTD
jgi:hypothetical protein